MQVHLRGGDGLGAVVVQAGMASPGEVLQLQQR